VSEPKFERATFGIVGTAPLVINKFSEKAQTGIREKQEAGQVGRNKKARDPRDFNANYEGSKHRAVAGWCGVNASAFRNALIRACSLTGTTMEKAKMCIFCIADGYDSSGMPLVKITKGEPHYHESYARNSNSGFDLRARAMWDPGWEMQVTLEWDAEQFDLQGIANLMLRVGRQVGIGEGRASSKMSAGVGWGHFTLSK
jgi:hypothetical protein